jgi:hypothetical protein
MKMKSRSTTWMPSRYEKDIDSLAKACQRSVLSVIRWCASTLLGFAGGFFYLVWLMQIN